jgi:hypothetical protein
MKTATHMAARANLTISAFVTCALFALSGSLATGCSSGSSDAAKGSAHVATGTASLPLVTTANGDVYRLANASLLICGQSCTYLSTTDDPQETEISTTLQTGSYQASLQYYELQKRDQTGTFQHVHANLVSSTTSYFSVFDGTTTTISYQFETDGVLVTVGQGKVNVTLDVVQTAAVCTPLGTDCAAGSWCPPAELTGNPLACIAAGDVAVGQQCGSATSCVGNSSCFDLGAGPVCVALCGSEDFGQPCGSGGTCVAVGETYGRCE